MSAFKEAFQKYNPEETPVMEFPTHSISMSGQYFFINQSFFEQIAPALSKKLSIKFIVNEADLWVKSTTALASIFLWITMLFIEDWAIILPSFLLFFLFWHSQKAALYIPSLSNRIYWLTSDLVWFLGSSIVLSSVAQAKNFSVFGLSLTLLFLLRTSLLQRLVDLLYSKLYKSSLNDRLVQFIIMKQSIYRGIPAAPLNAIAEEWKKRFSK